MTATAPVFDHVHLISEDPEAAASWYAEVLGGEIVRRGEVGGAPQIHVAFAGARVIVRGRRDGETASAKPGRQWGVDHFGFRVDGDLDAVCADMKRKGARFTLEPTDFDASTRIAYIAGPDGVSIELVRRAG